MNARTLGTIAASLLTLVATGSTLGAQTQAITYTTTACFSANVNCAATDNPTLGALGFNGVTNQTGTLTAGTPFNLLLGQFIATSSPNPGYNQDFQLFLTFTNPAGATPDDNVAKITGKFNGANNVVLNFTNNGNQTIPFTGGSFAFQVSDLTLPDATPAGGTNLYGTLTYTPAAVTTTPEPGSMALLGTGLVGLVPMVRRRKK